MSQEKIEEAVRPDDEPAPEGEPPEAEVVEEPGPEGEGPEPRSPRSAALTRGAAITAAARLGFADEQAEAIRRSVASECNDAEFVMFLEVCARHDLDPFAKQIWAAKISGRVQIIVSRDGLLQIANRNDDFRGMRGDVVHEPDAFKATYRQGVLEIEHTYEYGSAVKPGPEGEEDANRRTRSNIIGAWAMCEREGRHPTYFFAPFEEYHRQPDKTPWGSHPSAMILKCAESMALRKAYSISGVVGEDEVIADNQRVALTGELPYGDDQLGSRLRSLVKLANETVTGSYRDAKVRSLLVDREGFERELEGFLRDKGVDPPVEAEAVEEPEPAAA